jgi:acyl-CoA reductase-like NAD-dependent aldehyde dehydrogenase
MMVESVFINSGRSCINTSGIWASRHTREIAEAIAQRLAAVRPLRPSTRMPHWLPSPFRCRRSDLELDRRRSQGVGRDRRHGEYRDADRLVRNGKSDYLLPTVVHASSPDAAIAQKEFMFPFVTVVECPESKMLESIGPTLVCSAVTCNETFRAGCSTPYTLIV